MAEKKEQLRLTKSRWKLLRERIGKNIINSFQKINQRNEAVRRKKDWTYNYDLVDMSEEEQIEEILEEANAYNLREEVKTTAKKLLKKEPDLSELSAYVISYHEWIK